MSEQNFGGGASTALAEPGPEEAPELSNRPKPIVFIVAGAVLLVLAAAAYFLLFSGGGDSSTDTGAVVPSHAKVSTAPSKAATAPSKAPAVAVAGAAQGGGVDPFRAIPVASVATAPSASASPTATAGGGTGTPAGITATLLVNSVDFASNSANVSVNGKAYVAHAGEIFAKYFMMRVVITGSAQCAVFQFGDLPAQLCKGDKATFTS